MADITITAANVKTSNLNAVERRLAKVAVTAGQALALEPDDGTVTLFDADVITKPYYGVALNNAAAGQPVDFISVDSDFTIGGTVAAGVVYACSQNAGGICPIDDLSSATNVVVQVLGIGLSTTKVKLLNATQNFNAAK